MLKVKVAKQRDAFTLDAEFEAHIVKPADIEKLGAELAKG